VLSTTIGLPYKLTTGEAAGTFLAQLANKRILGSRCTRCERMMVPAQDFCAPCRTPGRTDSWRCAPSGSITGFTETETGVLALIVLDGADTPFVHKMLDVAYADLGDRSAGDGCLGGRGRRGMLDLAGFRPDTDGTDDPPASPTAYEGSKTERIEELRYQLKLEYQHAYGPLYGRLFDELATNRRIQGVRCPSCESVLVPPREYCDDCYVRTTAWVDVADTGVLKAFSIIHLEFKGQLKAPPYVYAEIVLDGASTKLIHVVGGIDIDKAQEILEPGMRVRAVWHEGEPSGTLADIEHFEPFEDDGS
jgi:uncharacterized protein